MRKEFANCFSRWKNEFGFPEVVIIEDKANGHALISELKSYTVIDQTTGKPINTQVISHLPKADKQERLKMVRGRLEGDYYKIPQFALWKPEYVYELENFPNAKHDDIVDATSMAINEIEKQLFR
jgi:predicted phage terminase large subunit-like protein